MDEKYTPHVQITGRDENGPAIDVEVLMKGSGESFDLCMTAIADDDAQADLSGFAKGKTAAEVEAAIDASARGKDAKYLPKLADVLR